MTSDSGMRKRLDEVDPFNLRGVIFAQLQRGKILEGFGLLRIMYCLP